MSRRQGRMLVPLLTMLSVLAMGVAGVTIMVQMKEREKRVGTERQLVAVTGERDELRAELVSVQTVKGKVESELAQVRQELTVTKNQLAKAMEQQQTLSSSLTDRQGELDTLGGDIKRLADDVAQLRKEREGLTTKVSSLEQERETLTQRLTDAEKTRTDLEAKLRESARVPTVQLDKVYVANEQERMAAPPQIQPSGQQPAARQAPAPVTQSFRQTPPAAFASASAPSAGFNGQVLVVNRDYDFVVIDIGKNQGLSIGQEFMISRGSEVLGKAKVEKVYDDLSAAALLPESREEKIREGDQVRAL